MFRREKIAADFIVMMLLVVTLTISVVRITPVAAKEKLTIWSHWADENSKKGFVMEAVNRFKKANPNFDVEVVWYQKPQLITALTTSFQAGTGPDIFYLEPAITGGFPPFVDNGFMVDLSKYLDQYIDPGALAFAKKGKMTYLLPLEAYMPMLYYNKDVFAKSGVKVPATGSFDVAELKEAVQKIKAAGFTPFSAGTMDRPWCGSILLENVILRIAGQSKWQGLASGKTAWTDPEVTAALKYVEELTKLGAYPNGVSAIKLGESHGLFFSGKYAMFPMKSFFGGRAFVPVESGGMAVNFPLGIMDMPKVKNSKANHLNYLQVGGSYGVYAGSKNSKKAAELLTIMAKPDMANLWMTAVKGQTGLKADVKSLDDPYLKALGAATKGLTLIPGPMELGMDASYMDVFFQTSTALVAGQMSAEEMIRKLETARGQLKK